MKTIKLITSILLLSVSNMLVAQIQIEHKKINEPMEAETINTTIRPILDSAVHDWTNGLRDDTALYFNVRSGSRGVDSNQRLIYFLHGLGGSPASWGGSYDGLTDKYEYFPKRPEYNFGTGTNQRDFKMTTYEAHASFGNKMDDYFRDYPTLADSVFKRLPPYVIGHSQGGLVARDMDMKHDTNDVYDTRVNFTNRRFWGIITFGTPHGGSYFAVRQDQLARLGSELTTTLAGEYIDITLANIGLKVPLFGGTIGAQGEKISDLIRELHEDKIVDKLFNLAAKGNRDPITKQYGPNSKYLLDTLNQYINPNMPKGLFYGVEEDPLIWRLVYYMVTDDPAESKYGNFGANDDSDLATNMEDMRLKAKANAIIYKGKANKSRSRRNWFLACAGASSIFLPKVTIGCATGAIIANNNMKNYNRIADANRNLKNYLPTVNLKYKAILGAINDSNLYRTDTIGYRCIKTQTVSFHNNGNVTTTVPRISVVSSSSTCPNDTSWTYSYTSSIYTQYNETYELEVITKQTLIETPSDAVVLKPSQMAFPGCLDMHKREMNEKYDPVLGIIPVGKSKVNHMQMRNCEETEAAMMRIYNGDGTMPYFFKLESK